MSPQLQVITLIVQLITLLPIGGLIFKAGKFAKDVEHISEELDKLIKANVITEIELMKQRLTSIERVLESKESPTARHRALKRD